METSVRSAPFRNEVAEVLRFKYGQIMEPYLVAHIVWAGVLVTLLWGSILTMRVSRNWFTILLLVGSGLSLLGFGGVFYAAYLEHSRTSYSDTSLMVGGVVLLFGIIVFCNGFIGLCAKYCATAKRAEELEGLLAYFQNCEEGRNEKAHAL